MPTGDISLLTAELEKYDWPALHSFVGGAARLPESIKLLVSAKTEEEAEIAERGIENIALIQGRLSECATPLTSCLVVGLDLAEGRGRGRIFDLLATIAGGYDDHVDIDSVGPVSVRDCVRRMADKLGLYAKELKENGNASCVDILLMCGVYDETVRDFVSDTFRSALELRSCSGIADLIEVSLADLY
ncbi:hypothetical protein [Streptomyces sp. NRRL B-24720]|uniref:hypothetical protein n=1 Tax=Streptomyces sp. NRRL B-24720 TaxID=1476876 RepID=UPI00131BFF85|nr:hypothetical protein [Streptomyces sp. NRRL B-24720]